MMRSVILFCLLAFPFSVPYAADDPQTITFPSRDGITITADVFIKHDSKAPFLVLFHRAGWSRGEYREIAPRLNTLGFNCMAVDLRSGDTVEGIDNETVKLAEQAGRGTTYIDTLPDMDAAVAYTREHYAKGKLGIWGSSYSASFVIKLLGDNAGFADAALAFAPGEYFAKSGKPDDWIATSAARVKEPVFVTSPAKEKYYWSGIYDAIPSGDKHVYLSASDGKHGSAALWERSPESPELWKEVEQFLNRYLK